MSNESKKNEPTVEFDPLDLSKTPPLELTAGALRDHAMMDEVALIQKPQEIRSKKP